MNRNRDFDEMAREWLNDGSDWTPPHVIDAVLLAVRTTPQEWDLRTPWRALSMRNPLYAAAAIVVLAVAGIVAFYTFAPRFDVGSGPTLSPTVQQTRAPSPTPTPGDQPIETTSWTTFESDRYGFTIGNPSDWTYVPADHDWTLAEDADNWLSTGQEVFQAPAGGVRVSAWSVAVDRTTTAETEAAVEAWVEAYCQASGNTPCTGIHDRAVPLCIEKRDCHPGLLVPFRNDVQAFLTGGIFGDNMVVVAVWRPESHKSVAPFGGSQRLLEAFLSTMEVWPESVPLEQRD